MRTLLIVVSVAVLGLSVCGCTNHTTPIAPQQELTQAEQNFEALWQATGQVLRKYRFELDRQDRRAGVITTQQMTGEHLGEFWRRDAATRGDLAEGTVQTLYRQAKVTIRPAADDGEQFEPIVEVRAYRSNRPDMQMTTTTEGYRMFRRPGRDTQKRLLESERALMTEDVSDLGRDERLEQQITEDIRAKAGKLRGNI